jgi:hypothetical protein
MRGCRGVDDISECLSGQKRAVNETHEIATSILHRIVGQALPVHRQRKQEPMLISCGAVKYEIRDRR